MGRASDHALEVLELTEERDALLSKLKAMTKCDCGLPLSRGKCTVCDNDE